MRVGKASGGGEVITSRDNRWLKEFRVALRGGVPTGSGAVGVEGVRLVEEALSSGCRVEAVLFGECGGRYRDRLAPLIGRPEVGFPVLRTTDRLFEGIADTEHPQGVAALVTPRAWTLEDVLSTGSGPSLRLGQAGSERTTDEIRKSKFETRGREDSAGPKAGATVGACAPLIVVLAGVQDPGNVGTILRTAAAFGATAAVTAATGQSGTASPFAPKALRASAGAALHLPIVSGMALGILLTQLKLRGIRTLASCVHEEQWRPAAAEAAAGDVPSRPSRESLGMNEWRAKENRKPKMENGETKYFPAKAEGPASGNVMAPWEVDWCDAVALLVGNEGAGLPEEVVHGADARIHISMASGVESLNAAAAAAVVLYEAFRQRRSVSG